MWIWVVIPHHLEEASYYPAISGTGYNHILHFLPIVMEQEHLTTLCLLEGICEDQCGVPVHQSPSVSWIVAKDRLEEDVIL
ncbi:hypothetical protein DSO57_1028561 [Entomophthora muscae]|uniref:Uncharacterized protein n=1 Tax=Entomophthora muscae TaxID=34485 RepID=A0ACC2RG54_9FUNG|nr:hypothetical protein DSO57_1028561 [Entomophthora muscae]